MALVFRWLLYLFLGMAGLALLALYLVYHLASRSLPDYDATLDVAGIAAPVDIIRDTANVPHIFGETDRDVFFGLGLAHAQDRLWQMTFLRRTAQGRLSEMFGARTLPIDRVLRRLDIYGRAVSSLDAQTPEAMAALTAYADGVNAWLSEVNRSALGRGAPEFFLFSNEIAPWQPADSLAIIKLMGLRLASHLDREVLRARLSLAVDEPRMLDLLPVSPGEALSELPPYASLFPGIGAVDYAVRQPLPLSPLPAVGFGGASNAWASGPSRTTSGGTLLANDPHLAFDAPSIWYLARLDLADGGVIGGTIPGLPLVLVGRSEDLAWGLTSAYLDDQDLMIEALNPDNPEEYQVPGGFQPFQTRETIINVRDAAPETLVMRETVNGPVLARSDFDTGTITPEGHVASLSWTLLSPRDSSYSAALAITRAKTVVQAIDAGKDYIAPAQNLVLADRDTVAMKLIGAMPRRAARHATKGQMPSQGWRPENRWQGRAGYAANPEIIAPEGGILGNTNNKTIDRPFPLHVSYDWGDTQRFQRWQRLMQNREVHTRESFMEAQLDAVSFSARSLLPLIGAELWFTGPAAPAGTPERQRQTALAMLADWNGEMNEHLPEPLLYSAWMRALQDRLIHDELGPLTAAFPNVKPLFLERVFRDVDGASAWCDVVQSAKVETCNEIATEALDEALIWVGETHGTALESLRWGDAHQATHDHPVLKDVPVLKWLVNIRQSTSGGDHTLNRGQTRGTGEAPFENTSGAGYRAIYVLADPDSSLFVTATGQSGHFLSRHYDDLGELWRRGEYIPMSLDPELARAGAVGITRLRPGN